MKSLSSVLSVGTLLLLTGVNTVQAQTGLGIQIYTGTNITGSIGSIYSVQATTNPAQPNSWTTVAVVKLLDTNHLWLDTSFPANSRRFYRTVAFTNVPTNMVFIPAGTFLMGSPTTEANRDSSTTVTGELQHPVTISKGFFMGRYLVTQTNYFSVTGNNPSHFTNNPNNPVEQIIRFNAKTYCGLLTTNEQASGAIPTNWIYRLPTEAEWEYACRAGSTAAFSFGSSIRSGMADFNGTSEYDSAVGTIPNPFGTNPQATQPVGTYFSNAWGLYDMVGNVAQLTYDNAPAIYTSASVTDPAASQTGPLTLKCNVRGGSWASVGSACRSASRQNLRTGDTGYSTVGFRVVLVPAQ